MQRLAIPPAWGKVWICPNPDGHLQAVGRDARGRKQYRYHQHWREVRDETKYGQLIAFGRALPAIRRQVERDLARAGLPRERVLAAVVSLLESTMMRIGNEEYARSNQSFSPDDTARPPRQRHRPHDAIQFSARVETSTCASTIGVARSWIPRTFGLRAFQYMDEQGARRASIRRTSTPYLRDCR
jgi:DNA topoisomerase-1